jgi:hypothetical protein
VVLDQGAVLWPAFTLLVGVLCGVTTFAEEQKSGANRFLGDQRLSPRSVWLIKTGLRFFVAAVASLLVLVPSLVRAMDDQTLSRTRDWPLLGRVFEDDLLGILAPPGVFLGMWLLHGFGIGQLCGLLVRKTFVAVVMALVISGLAACVWLPSLAGGGLHFWQVAGVPVLALAASYRLLTAWAAGRLAGREKGALAAGMAVLSLLWTAFALWMRVAEVPDLPDPLDMEKFVATMPDPEHNEAGRLTRSACESFAAHLRKVQSRRATKGAFGKDKSDPIDIQMFARGDVGANPASDWTAGEPAHT